MSASSAAKPPVDRKPLPNQSNAPPTKSSPHSHQKTNRPQPSRFKLTYDIVMMIAISIDLLLISIDAILMSNFSTNVAGWLTISDGLNWYQAVIHDPLRTAGGFFTILLIVELLIRWAVAIKQQIYYRWFFFPFIHWYEVLGCFPQLRALRLFRAVVIGRRLYQLGYQVLPQPWLNRIKFYINLLLEELSDRVILTTIHNYRQQLTDPKTQQSLIESTIARNRDEIEATLLSLLRQELAPQLHKFNGQSEAGNLLASEVGNAIQEGLANTPELRRYLRMIPIAGSLIESQLLHIGHNVGENVVHSINKRLLDSERIDSLMIAIAHGISHIETNNSALETLIATIISDSLSEFEAQIKVQQWKNQDLLKF
ncbi:hypothetical protein ES754_09665 [Psychrobacter frigidicola]|uniref:Preprotein translocase subunit SecA n=1 Tax=Psychrobacter frigidicola TaxID=45611 RepID=A0A5C7A6I9_9GAMM|nr:hypothetical protein [Psychrobacter frigidicola]TXD96407.1 hypothetical protein ES754_09665 [Psychrobacter frigidicola]